MLKPGRAHSGAVLAGWLAAAVQTFGLLWPSWGSGQLLYRDFVAVPNPVWSARVIGADGSAPRAVPLDFVTTLLAQVLPSGVQQQVMLSATLLLAGGGVTMLLRRFGWVATVTAATLASWSPYAGERLLLGQPPTLLAWSMLPWLVVAARSSGPRWVWLLRVALAAAPAALTPFGGLVALVTVVSTVAFDRTWALAQPSGADGGLPEVRSRADVAWVTSLGLSWCLPWLVAALVGTSGRGQREGAAAFAVRADGGWGVLEVLSGGGIWSPAATLGSRATLGPRIGSLLVLVVAGVGVAALWRRRPDGAGWVATSPAMLGIGLVAGPPVLVYLLANEPFLGWLALAQELPGVSIVRDTHRVLAVSAMALVILSGVGAATIVGAVARRVPGRLGVLASVGGTLVVAALGPWGAPDLLGRLHTAYRPVEVPAGWARAVDAVGDGRVLDLPWQPFRQQPWAGPEPFLDPLPLAVRGPVLAGADLVVQRGPEQFHVGPAAPPGASDWAAGRIDATSLRDSDIDVVFEWLTTPGTVPQTHPGLTLVYSDDTFRVWRVPR
jgi:hypothetical protein